jgi:threonine dehydrogenase-like Zn-dependent dehydrogenase
MADEIRVPARALVPLPSGIALRDALLVEALAVVVYALRRSGLRADQRVAVVGGGTIGLCAVAAARARGAEVALVARHDAQREAGERLGATEC